MKRLQWRSGGSSNNASADGGSDGNGTSASTLLLPPSTSPLSRKIGLPTPGINKIRGVEGRRGDVVDDTTIASGRTWRSGVSTRTLKWSNRRGRNVKSDASVASSINSRLPPLARLRKQNNRSSTPVEESNNDKDDEEDNRVVLGSSITITTNNGENVYRPKKEAPVNNNNNADSPTSVLQEQMFTDGSNNTMNNDNCTGEYRTVMDRMRKLMIGNPDDTETSIVESNTNNTFDESCVFDNLPSSSVVATSDNQEEEDQNSIIIETSRHTGPIDVDTCTRHITPAERHNLRAMHKLGYHYLRHNEIHQALEVFLEILRGQRERHGPRSLEMAMAMHNLGVVCVKAGRFEEGIRLCDGAARIRVEKLGSDHLDVAVSLAQQGVALMEIKQYPLALASFQEALRIRRKAVGVKHPLVIRLLNNIGCAYFEMNKLDDAKVSFDEALAVQRDLLKDKNFSKGGVNDEEQQDNGLDLEERNLEADPKEANNMLLSIALTLCNLGSIHLRWGMYDESLTFYEDALMIQESVLGEDHQVVKNTKTSLDFVVKSRDENRQNLLESHISPSNFPSILNMNRLANLILPKYEEGKKICDKISNDIAVLIDPAPQKDNASKQDDFVGQPFICGQPYLCANETENEDNYMTRKTRSWENL